MNNCHCIPFHVIPAQAGIHKIFKGHKSLKFYMDSCLRGNDIIVFVYAFFFTLFITTAHANITPKVITTPQGIKAWLYQDTSTPVIAMSFFFRAGGTAEPKGKEGVLNMMRSLVLRGAGDYNHAAFEEALLDKAITLNIAVTDDGVQGSLTTLVENKDQAINLASLVINKPRFDPKELELVRNEALNNLANIQNKPNYIGNRALEILMYNNNYYGHDYIGSTESLKSITVDDIKKARTTVQTKDRLIIGISGNIDEAGAIAMIDQIFGILPATSGPSLTADIAANSHAQFKQIKHPAPQAYIAFAQSGLKLNDPDLIKANLMMYILGTSAVARLTEEVREKQGLAYTVGANLDPYLYSGLISGSCGTKIENANESVELIKREWQRMRDSGPTAKELEDAKQYALGSYALHFTHSNGIAGLMVTYQMAGRSPDYFQKRTCLIQGCSLDDIKAVCKKWLKPEELTFVVVGNSGLEEGKEDKQ